MRSFFILFLFVMLGMVSCVPYKNIIYLQDGKITGDTIKRQKVQYKVQPQDRLTIQVNSYDKEVTSFYNLSLGSSGGGNQNLAQQQGRGSLYSYLVDDSGYVEIPLLPKIKVAGRSVEAIRDTVQSLIREQVMDAYVIVRLAEYKVTVFGEAGEQVIYFNDDQINLFEVVAQAGLTRYSNRKDIQLVRQEGDVYRIVSLDITQKDIMASEYFYLQPNDIIYVRPVRLENFLDNMGTVTRVIGLTSIVYFIQRLFL